MEHTREKLKALWSAASRKTEVQTLLDSRRSEWEMAHGVMIQRERELSRENADAERLEQKNLVNLFYTVTGQMGDKREVEAAEAAEAQELYEIAKARTEELYGQIVMLEAELRELGNCDKDLETLLTQMTDEALASGDKLAAEIAEIKARVDKNTAEAEELGDLLIVGKRLNRVVGEMLPILWNAAEREKRRQADGPLPPYRHGHTFKSEVNAILDQAETYLPMLVSLAKTFSTKIMDLPPLGQLQTVQNTFDGTYTVSTLTQIERTAAELESLANTVNRSMEKTKRIKQNREETRDAARNHLIDVLTAEDSSL
ncbi:MAG: hypothetical protein IJA91_03700 [Clostridia bacterium]|nr:hypothetical protein [Clostridia bacterium]